MIFLFWRNVPKKLRINNKNTLTTKVPTIFLIIQKGCISWHEMKSTNIFFFFLICVFLLLHLFRFAPSFFFYHQTSVISTQNWKPSFFFWNELSITMALVGRHYPFPMWRVGYVATSPPFFWFVIFFFFFNLFVLIALFFLHVI